jgi:cysteine desulfurase
MTKTSSAKIKRIYLDNGATTIVDPKVIPIINKFYSEVYGNASSLHDFGREAHAALDSARKTIADEIHARPEEIIFTSGGTESDNLAIKGAASAHGHGHIITSKIEHPAVLNVCKELEGKGFRVTYLDVDGDGLIDLAQLERSIQKDTFLISIMHANNEIGTIEPIVEIGKIAKKYGVLFHTDAVQSFTKVPIDVSKMNVDMISMSAHKLHGPKGVGALYVRNGTKISPMSVGGSHERKLRAGTENIPGIAGFAEAVKQDKKLDYIKKLRERLITGLLQISDTRLNGHPEKRLANNVNISFRYIEGESILFHLDEAGIAVSTGSACSSHSLEPSHVLMAMGLEHVDAQGAIRFTLSKFNTNEEIDYTIDVVKGAVKTLRSMSPLMHKGGK